MAVQKNNNAGRERSGFLGMSRVGEEVSKQLRVTRIFRQSETIANVGPMSADNICYVQLPIGPYTYRTITIEMLAAAAIVGKTETELAEHWVKTAAMADYIEWVAIEINGREVIKLRTAELIALNAYHNLDTLDGVLTFAFGHAAMFEDDRLQDAYLFGTQDLASAKVLIKTKPGLPAGMKPRINLEYAPIRRRVGFFATTTVNEYTFAGSGKQIITDIPNGVDWQAIWVIPQDGASVKSVLLEVDRQIAFEASSRGLRLNQGLHSKDVAALPGIMIDAFRDRKAVGFDAVTNQLQERRRGSDVRLTLDLTAAGSFRIITIHCGLFNDQR